MLSMFETPVFKTRLAREYEFDRFTSQIIKLYGYPLPFSVANYQNLRDAFHSGAFGVPESYACVLAFVRDQMCSERQALIDIIFYRDEWFVPLDSWCDPFTIKSFLSWLKNQNTTGSL